VNDCVGIRENTHICLFSIKFRNTCKGNSDLCGIFGCLLREGKVAPIIHEALKRLEYRGYDSVGIATINQGKIAVKKDVGKIGDVHKLLDLNDLQGTIGLGHCRWATHGAPSKNNAHPHLDSSGKVAVVHNGIIENFIQLKEELVTLGHIFVSRTDTEVIPHLIEEELKKGLNFLDSVKETVKRLEGSYALAAIYAGEPTKIVCARQESPLERPPGRPAPSSTITVAATA